MNKKFFAALASATMAFTASGSIAVFADDFVEEKTPVVDNGDVTQPKEKVLWNEDNLASATMAFTASGSIAVFADDFVEEKTPVVDNGDVTQPKEKVLWNEDNFGALVTVKNTATWTGYTPTPDKDGYVKTEDLEKITAINLQKYFEGEIKGLEYFTKLETFDDSLVDNKTNVTNTSLDFSANTALKTLTVTKAADLSEIVLPEPLETFDDSLVDNKTNVTNTSLDFSANTALKTLTVTKAADLSEIVLPEPAVDEKTEEKTYSLATLTLKDTALTSLDLSAQDTLGTIEAAGNKNLKEVTVQHGTKRTPRKYESLNLSSNNLETVNLDFVNVVNGLNLNGNHIAALDLSNTKAKGTIDLADQTFYVNNLETVNLDFVNVVNGLNLNGNHIAALDLSNTKAKGTIDLADQTFYVSETLENVNLAETFENFDKAAITGNKDYNKETGVLKLGSGKETEYKYNTLLGAADKNLTVKLEKANPMNRLYNPNSGEHFYTASIEEKAALVKLGWNDEGYGWVAPRQEEGVKAVYRLYNPNAGDHHYTTSEDERDTLKAFGWKYEGEGWKSAADSETPVYRQYNYNPNAGDHHYTTSEDERDTLKAFGWKYEGEGWKSAADSETPVYRQYNPYANGAGAHNYTTNKAENDFLLDLGWVYEGKAWFALQ